MKDEYKILIGAIIVILIVLVGAYAMGGSNNPGPSVTPTALPVTATPTTVPEGGGSTGGTPSATPTAVPTATAPTPTPEPESGVKLTEFGYWITYPPLGPQNWSTNPPPNPSEWNVVYFDPTSEDVFTTYILGAIRLGPHGTAMVHRLGDLNGTINVTIQASNSSNTWLAMPLSTPDYIYSVVGLNLTKIGNNIYTLRFDPGVSEQTLFIPINYYIDSVGANTVPIIPPEGTVKLTITGIDGGYSVGSKYEYTANINPPTATRVTFIQQSGDAYRLYNPDTHLWFMTTSGVNGFTEYENGTAAIYIPLTRYSDGGPVTAGDLDVPVQITYRDNVSMACTIVQPHFSDGSSTATLTVKVPISFVVDGYYNQINLDIQPGDYGIVPYGSFTLWINRNN